MADAAAPIPAPSEYKDRSTGLLVAGVIEICLGVLAALAVPLVLLSAIMMRRAAGERLPLTSILPSLLFYVFVACFLVIMGIGSIQARRWARALMLIASWIWLIVGIFSTGLAIFVLPASMKVAAQGPRSVSPALLAGMITGFIVLAAFLYIVLPLAFLLFYGSQHVKETCNRRDPVERWTDRAPLPVIGLSLLLAYFAATYVILGFFRPVIPLFRWILAGAPAQLVCLALAFIWVYLAISIFRREIAGWWLTLLAVLFTATSTAVAFSGGGLLRFYERSGMSPQQLELMRRIPLFQSSLFLWAIGAGALVFLGYILWLRRYFGTSTAARQ